MTPKQNRNKLLHHLDTARASIASALVACDALCESTPHATDLQYRAMRGRLARMGEMAGEAGEILESTKIAVTKYVKYDDKKEPTFDSRSDAFTKIGGICFNRANGITAPRKHVS